MGHDRRDGGAQRRMREEADGCALADSVWCVAALIGWEKAGSCLFFYPNHNILWLGYFCICKLSVFRTDFSLPFLYFSIKKNFFVQYIRFFARFSAYLLLTNRPKSAAEPL